MEPKKTTGLSMFNPFKAASSSYKANSSPSAAFSAISKASQSAPKAAVAPTSPMMSMVPSKAPSPVAPTSTPKASPMTGAPATVGFSSVPSPKPAAALSAIGNSMGQTTTPSTAASTDLSRMMSVAPKPQASVGTAKPMSVPGQTYMTPLPESMKAPAQNNPFQTPLPASMRQSQNPYQTNVPVASPFDAPAFQETTKQQTAKIAPASPVSSLATFSASVPSSSAVSTGSAQATPGMTGAVTPGSPAVQNVSNPRDAAIQNLLSGFDESEDEKRLRESEVSLAQRMAGISGRRAQLSADSFDQPMTSGARRGFQGAISGTELRSLVPLQTNLAMIQAAADRFKTQREGKMEKAKMELELKYPGAKFEKVGNDIVSINPATGQYQVVYQGKGEGFSLSEGQTRYDAQGNPIATSAKTGGTGSDKLLSVSEAQALGVPYGTTEAQAMGRFATGKPSVDEAKARQFAVSAANANKVLETLGYDQGIIESGLVPNFAKSADRQQFEQASRAFVNSVLRRESGATITDDEFNNKKAELIDQPGDAAEVKAQKAAARRAAVQSITEAGGQAQGENPLGI